MCRDRARAFLCSSPVTPPAFSPCRAQARASPAPDGSVMSLAEVRKWRAGLPGWHAACSQGTGRAAVGVTARAFSAGVPPARQPVTSFALSIVYDSGCLWQPVMVHAPPTRLHRSPGQRVNEDVSGVAVAGVAPKRRSSPALCTAAAPYSPVLVRQLTPFHLTTLLLDGPLRRPLRRYTAHAGGSATPVATAP